MIAVEDIVRGLWQALSRRDWDAVKTFLSDDCLYVDVPVPALSARGPEDIVKRLKMGLEQLAGYQNHPGVLVSNGSTCSTSIQRHGHSPPASRACCDSSPSTR